MVCQSINGNPWIEISALAATATPSHARHRAGGRPMTSQPTRTAVPTSSAVVTTREATMRGSGRAKSSRWMMGDPTGRGEMKSRWGT